MKSIIVLTILALMPATAVQAQPLPASGKGKQLTVFLEPPVDSSLLRPHLAVLRNRPGTTEAAQAQFEIAQIHYRGRVYSSAVTEFQKVLAAPASSSLTQSALLSLARSLAQLHRDEEVLSTLETLQKQFPQTSLQGEPAFLRSQSSFRLLRFTTAAGEAENALAGSLSREDRLEALIVAGRSYKALGKSDKALQAFERLAVEAPTSELTAEAELEAGLIHRQRRRWSEGEKAFRRALERFTHTERKEEVRYELGMLFFEKGTFVRASWQFDSLLTLSPNSRFAAHALFYLGRCYIYHKKYDKAVSEFVAHQSRFPDYPRGDLLLFYLAEAYRLQGNAALARASLQQLLSRYPKSSLKPAAEKLLRG